MPIMEQGYQHWSGRVSGHSWRWLAITRHGVGIQMRNRFLRYVLFAAWSPALLLVGMLSIWGLLERKSNLVAAFVEFMRFMNPTVIADPRYYRVEIWRLSYGYFMHVELFFSMILILLVGPGLISQDLRVNALPLYFSRPLRRVDYFLGKLGVISFFLGMVTILPTCIAYFCGLLFSLNLHVAVQTFGILIGALLYGLIICLSAGTLMLALSALSRNSRYVALFWLGLWFVTSVISSVLEGVHHEEIRHAYFYNRPRPPALISAALPPGAGTEPGGRITPGFPHHGIVNGRQYWRNFQRQRLRDSQTDWRPMVSYTANILRIGSHLLGTNQAWEKLATLEPDKWRRRRMLMRYAGLRYPWYWSVGVLAGLFGLSICVLKWSIRSLDRLK